VLFIILLAALAWNLGWRIGTSFLDAFWVGYHVIQIFFVDVDDTYPYPKNAMLIMSFGV
jgi:hypothetical protein